jgi:hypothetical protein
MTASTMKIEIGSGLEKSAGFEEVNAVIGSR